MGTTETAVWNRASTHFDVHKSDIKSAAADNIFMAWPPILHLITTELPDSHGLQALDYGCGTGGFAQELCSLGFRVTGIDYAEEMIAKAKKHCDPTITFRVGDHTAIERHSRFNLISSIMTLQFVADIEQMFQAFSRSIESGGLLAFAVFNPEWVSACLHARELFTNFDSVDNPGKGMMQLGEDRVPVFIRSSDAYEKLAKANGFTKIMESKPPYTKEFLARYSPRLPTNSSQYLLMGFSR